MFWFAWTNYPSIHWIVSIIATAPFGFGMVLVFLSIMNYLIDAYVIYAGMSLIVLILIFAQILFLLDVPVLSC